MESQVYRLLGRAVAKRRKELGLTQQDISKKIGLTRASLANIETGRQKVLLHHVYRLTAALDLQSLLDLIPPTIDLGDGSTRTLIFSGSPTTVAEKMRIQEMIRKVVRKERKV